MTKYNQSFKQQAIEFYRQNGKNRSLTRQHFQLAKTTLECWVHQYNHYSANGLAVLGKKQIYSPEFKLSVVQAVKNGQFYTRNAFFHFGIPNSGIVSQWLQAFDQGSLSNLVLYSGGYLKTSYMRKSKCRKIVVKSIFA